MICVLCFGRPFGFVSEHADCYHLLKTLEERLPIVEKFSIFTEMNHLLSLISRILLLKRILPSAADRNGIGKIIGVLISLYVTHVHQSANQHDRSPVT